MRKFVRWAAIAILAFATSYGIVMYGWATRLKFQELPDDLRGHGRERFSTFEPISYGVGGAALLAVLVLVWLTARDKKATIAE